MSLSLSLSLSFSIPVLQVRAQTIYIYHKHMLPLSNPHLRQINFGCGKVPPHKNHYLSAHIIQSSFVECTETSHIRKVLCASSTKIMLIPVREWSVMVCVCVCVWRSGGTGLTTITFSVELQLLLVVDFLRSVLFSPGRDRQSWRQMDDGQPVTAQQLIHLY